MTDIQTPEIDPLPPLELGYFCSNSNQCNTDSVCDYDSICRLKDGATCTADWQCNSNAYCSGTCINNDTPPNLETGVVKDPCPCRFNYICSDGICLAGGSIPCNDNSECFSGYCSPQGTCLARSPDGTVCSQDDQCASLNCSMVSGLPSVCQPTGIDSGENGAFCSSSVPCDSGLACRDGKCIPSFSGLEGDCNSNNPCPNIFQCYSMTTNNTNITTELCEDNEFGCTCNFNFTGDLPRPNVPINNTCPDRSTFDQGICKYNAGSICRVGDNCMSGNCPADGNIFVFSATAGNYPSDGVVGINNLSFSPVDNPFGNTVIDIAVDSSFNIDVVIVVTTDGAYSGPNWQVVRLNTQSLTINGCDITSVPSGIRYPLYIVNDSSIYLGNNFFPVNSINGVQTDTNSNVLTIDSLSSLGLVAQPNTTQGYLQGIPMVIGSGSKVYYKSVQDDTFTLLSINATNPSKPQLILLSSGDLAVTYISVSGYVEVFNLDTQTIETSLRFPYNYGGVVPNVVNYDLTSTEQGIYGFILASIGGELVGFYFLDFLITPISGNYDFTNLIASSENSLYLFSSRVCI